MRSIRNRSLALTVVVMLLTMSLGAGVAAADGGRDHRNAENTFTKWVTGAGAAPVIANMAGIVGGDVGDGAFAGEVLSLSPPPPRGHRCRLPLQRSRHAFTANVHVVQTGLTAVSPGGSPMGG